MSDKQLPRPTGDLARELGQILQAAKSRTLRLADESPQDIAADTVSLLLDWLSESSPQQRCVTRIGEGGRIFCFDWSESLEDD